MNFSKLLLLFFFLFPLYQVFTGVSDGEITAIQNAAQSHKKVSLTNNPTGFYLNFFTYLSISIMALVGLYRNK